MTSRTHLSLSAPSAAGRVSTAAESNTSRTDAETGQRCLDAHGSFEGPLRTGALSALFPPPLGHAAPQECGHKRLILQGKLETGDVGEGAMAPAEDERFQPKKARRVQRRDPVEICHADVGFQPP